MSQIVERPKTPITDLVMDGSTDPELCILASALTVWLNGRRNDDVITLAIRMIMEIVKTNSVFEKHVEISRILHVLETAVALTEEEINSKYFMHVIAAYNLVINSQGFEKTLDSPNSFNTWTKPVQVTDKPSSPPPVQVTDKPPSQVVNVWPDPWTKQEVHEIDVNDNTSPGTSTPGDEVWKTVGGGSKTQEQRRNFVTRVKGGRGDMMMVIMKTGNLDFEKFKALLESFSLPGDIIDYFVNSSKQLGVAGFTCYLPKSDEEFFKLVDLDIEHIGKIFTKLIEIYGHRELVNFLNESQYGTTRSDGVVRDILVYLDNKSLTLSRETLEEIGILEVKKLKFEE